MPKAKQVAVIPWRVKGGLQVLLIRKRSRLRWGIPKGHIRDKANDYHKAALEECHEEAGAFGPVSTGFMGDFTYKRAGERHHVRVLTQRVRFLAPTYPEARIRERAWFNLEDAIQQVGRKAVKQFLANLPQWVGAGEALRY